MANKETVLFEKALNSSSDAERVACLNQLKKIYRGTGAPAVPEQPVTPVRVVSSGDATRVRDMEQQLTTAVELAEKFRDQRDTAKMESDELRAQIFSLTNTISMQEAAPASSFWKVVAIVVVLGLLGAISLLLAGV